MPRFAAFAFITYAIGYLVLNLWASRFGWRSAAHVFLASILAGVWMFSWAAAKGGRR